MPAPAPAPGSGPVVVVDDYTGSPWHPTDDDHHAKDRTHQTYSGGKVDSTARHCYSPPPPPPPPPRQARSWYSYDRSYDYDYEFAYIYNYNDGEEKGNDDDYDDDDGDDAEGWCYGDGVDSSEVSIPPPPSRPLGVHPQ